MKIRLYNENDFEQILTLFNENSDYDKMTVALMREKIDDPQFDPESFFVTETDGRIVGFMFGVQREIRGEKYGYIKLMVVHKDYRRQGIARGMFEKLEAYYIKCGVEIFRIYDTTANYWMPGIDPRYTAALCFAWRFGFERFVDTCNLNVDLQNQDWSMAAKEAKLLKEGIIIKRADDTDKASLMRFIEKEFALWHDEVSMSFKSNPIAMHVAIVDGEVQAFSGHNGNNMGTGWFGPMGTDPALRGKGIGEILLKRCLQDMKDWGLANSIIPWVGPIGFYSHFSNAVISRVFWRFEKRLKGEGKK